MSETFKEVGKKVHSQIFENVVFKCLYIFLKFSTLNFHIFKAHSDSKEDLPKEKTKSVKLIGDDKKGFKCEVCDKKFVKEGNLKLHQRKDHGPQGKGM